jgi:hypothetical protein
MDTYGLPEGVEQKIMRPIYEQFPNCYWSNYIPVSPESVGGGASKITYPRISYYGGLGLAAIGSNVRREVNIGLENISFDVYPYKSYFRIDRDEERRLNNAMQAKDFMGAINLLSEKQKATEQDAALVRDELLCRGQLNNGIIGFVNSPDVLRLTLTEAFPSTTAADNIRVFAQAQSMIVSETGGKYKGTTLVLPPMDYQTLAVQSRSSTSASDTTTLTYFKNTQNQVMFEGGRMGEFEIAESSQLENCRGAGLHAAVMFVRTSECVSQVVPFPLQMFPPVSTMEGYTVSVDAEYCGAHIKHPYTVVIIEYARS